MKKFVLVMIGFFVMSAVLVTTAQAADIKEGKWSMTMVTQMGGAMGAEADAAMKEMENMPPEARAMMQQMQGQTGMQMGVAQGGGISTTVTQCVTNQNPVPEAPNQEHCTQTHEIKGNTVNFHVTCNERDMKMDSAGHVTYTGDSMEGQVKSKQTTGGESTDAAITITGKYLGPCDR